LIALQLKEKQNRLQFIHTEPITNYQVATLIALQTLDVYTTYRGLKYDCVREINPLMGESPSVGKMLFTKAAILTPALQYDYNNGSLSPKIMNDMNFLMSIVVANNYHVLQDAKRYCVKK